MFSVYLYFHDRWLQQQRTDQFPTDSTGYAEKCANTVRSMLKHKQSVYYLLWVSYVRVESVHVFANLASFLAGTCTTTFWLPWSQMLWRTTEVLWVSKWAGLNIWLSSKQFSGRIIFQSTLPFRTSMNPFTLTNFVRLPSLMELCHKQAWAREVKEMRLGAGLIRLGNSPRQIIGLQFARLIGRNLFSFYKNSVVWLLLREWCDILVKLIASHTLSIQ